MYLWYLPADAAREASTIRTAYDPTAAHGKAIKMYFLSPPLPYTIGYRSTCTRYRKAIIGESTADRMEPIR